MSKKHVYIVDEVSTNKNERPELGFEGNKTIEIVQSRKEYNNHTQFPFSFPMAFTQLPRYLHTRSRHLAQSGMHE